MENLEEFINQNLKRQLQFIANKNQYPYMDWIAFERIVFEQAIPHISNAISKLIRERSLIKI